MGFKLDSVGYSVMGFVGWCERRGLDKVEADAAVQWATVPGKSAGWHAQRLSAVRGFARHHALKDPGSQAIPSGLLESRAWRRTPFLFAPDQTIALMGACRQIIPCPAKAAACEHLIGLLAATGMRISEACALNLGDIAETTLPDGATVTTLTIRDTKFGKTRVIPVLDSTRDALDRYRTSRDRRAGTGAGAPLFTSQAGTRFAPPRLRRRWWPRLLEAAGIASFPGGPRIVPHSLRHTFAVDTLTGWHLATAEDIDAKMVWLSTYMGHVDPATTYWYLQAAPVLLAAAERSARP
jgi:integrase